MNPLMALSLVAASAVAVPLVSSDTTVQTAPAAADDTAPSLFSTPGKELGSGYTSSSDAIVQATGDAEGLHILAARESDAFSFYEIARLNRKELSDVGPWTGYVCTTGSGNYAAAVYAPSMWSNEPGAYARGAFAAVIRLSDGKVTEVPERVQLAYFTPGCGAGDEVAFTSSSATDESVGSTTVISVDAATGAVSSRRTVKGFLTHVTPTRKGTFGVLDGNLVDLKGDGKKLSARKLAAVPGPMFALTASKNGTVDIGTVDGKSSVISRFNGKDFTELGRAPKGKVELLPVADGAAVVGQVKGIDTSDAPGLFKHAVDGRVTGISRHRHLVTHSVFSEQMKGLTTRIGSASKQGAGTLTVKATALKTGAKATTLVDADRRRPKPDTSLPMDPAAFVTADDDDPPTCGEGGPESQCLSGSGVDHYGLIGQMETPCIVKRNDPKRQALQASANQVEWAVDQAVHGTLTITRPQNWHDTGLAAYTPQGLFPKPKLTGGGEIPAQVMLGILAQESNFKQASWHSMNGDSGNVTRSDWFGNENGIHYYPDRSKADCGYGIAQVTTGMSWEHSTQYDALRAGAITTDYAANIAAGLEILAEKWNQLKALGMNTNNGSPAYLENWYTALWGYNSGVYTSGSVGLGFFNNPVNPSYPADRHLFLRDSYEDASTPSEWSYQEKVLGWAETPQLTWNGEESYSEPNMPLGRITDAPHDLFCDPGINACDPDAADPCPSWDEQCRWDGSVNWMGSSQSTSNSTTEKLSYSLGSGEPALQSKYGHGPCIDHPSVYTGAIIVDNLGEHEDTYGCGDFEAADDGKFTLQVGDNFTMQRDDGSFRATPYIAGIDLHQLGAGYDHHVYFTHSYEYTEPFHRVTGRWQVNQAKLPSGDQPGQRYKVYVHLPAHGAEAVVRYDFIPGDNTAGAKPDYCNVNQGTRSAGKDTWFEMGTFTFWKGGRIEMDNIHKGGTGDDNVVFDAIAFVPFNYADPGPCALVDGGL
ncbi:MULTISPECIES: hypothetical protein [unclassified Streptomyces]|uniref:hypothetical protein n=1 Tax=unclassified Streptomyces TaxID=2593676 RepID=UPI00093F1512|nr:hypothetical protein [Streptomyces sp. CB02400]OKK13803.1 hypothetical protein AMK33_03000 [Streptomyces sp. CB02400]